MRAKRIFPSEAQEGYALVKWSSFHPICRKYLIHIRNGGSLKSSREGANFKRSGVKAGVSDYLLAYPVNGFAGLWLELKSRSLSAKLSIEQRAWLDLMAEAGYAAYYARGWEQARDIIKSYLGEVKAVFSVMQ